MRRELRSESEMMMTDKTTVSVIKPAEAAEVAALINAAYRGHNDVAFRVHIGCPDGRGDQLYLAARYRS